MSSESLRTVPGTTFPDTEPMANVFQQIDSVGEFRAHLRDVANALNHPAVTDNSTHVDDSAYRWYVNPKWGETDLTQLTEQDWLLVAELLKRSTHDPHLAGLVGSAQSRAGTLSKWALTSVVRDGDAMSLFDRSWREQYAPAADEYWFFTYPSNASGDDSIEDRIKWARGTQILRHSVDTAGARQPEYGPFDQDYLLIADVLLEFFYHPVLLTAYCSPVWRALELSATFVGAAGAPAGDLRGSKDSSWYQLTHPGRPPWERMADHGPE